jgi:hypothetical protein
MIDAQSFYTLPMQLLVIHSLGRCQRPPWISIDEVSQVMFGQGNGEGNLVRFCA